MSCSKHRCFIYAISLLALLFILVGCGPGRYYNKGVERYNEGNYDKAISEFRKALEKDKKGEFPETPDWIVKCYLARARENFSSDIYAAVADCECAVREAETLNASEETTGDARGMLQRAIEERDRRSAEAKKLVEQARSAIEGKRDLTAYESARQSLEEALRLDPRNLDAASLLSQVKQAITKLKAEEHFGRAVEYEKERKWTECVVELEECLRLDPTHSQARVKLAEAEKLAVAERRYREYMTEVSFLTGRGIETVEQADEALALCEKAIAEYEFNDEAVKTRAAVSEQRDAILKAARMHYEAGLKAKEQEDYEKARNEFEACLNKYAGHGEAARELAKVKGILEKIVLAEGYVKEGNSSLAAGKPYEAKKAFEDALDLVPDMPEAIRGKEKAEAIITRLKTEARSAFEKAERLVNGGKYEDALPKLDEAVLKDPDNLTYKRKRDEVVLVLARQHYARGREYEKKGEWDKAAAEYKIAASHDDAHEKDYQRVLDEKAADEQANKAESLYFLKGDWYNAAVCYKNAMELSASRKTVFEDKMEDMLAKMMTQEKLYESEGRYDEALSVLDKIVLVSETYGNAEERATRLRAVLDDAQEHYDNALIASREKRYIAAEDELEAILDILPKHEEAQNQLKIVREKIGKAKKSFERAERFEGQEQYELAQTCYEECAEICVDYPDAEERASDLEKAETKYDLAVELRQQKKLEEALVEFREVASIRTDYKDVQKHIEETGDLLAEVRYHYKEGVKAQGKKDWDEAISRFEQVLKVIYKYKDTAERLAACIKARG
jgi:tetratricopeptide (TPR) repeat protein